LTVVKILDGAARLQDRVISHLHRGMVAIRGLSRTASTVDGRG